MLESTQPQANAKMNRGWRLSKAYIATMNVTAIAPNTVSTDSVRSGALSGCTESESERDGVERGLVLWLRYRDRQASLLRFPAQVEERAALPLGGDHILNESRLYTTIQVHSETAGRAVDERGAAAGPPVALQLPAQARLVKGTARGHR